jgi:acyl CoA:acetate/3-ketoacid CoA transferase alpha subunit
MSNEQVTQRQLNAELKAVEERIDRRHAELAGKMETVIVRSETLAQSVQSAAAGIGALHTKIEENQ